MTNIIIPKTGSISVIR